MADEVNASPVLLKAVAHGGNPADLRSDRRQTTGGLMPAHRAASLLARGTVDQLKYQYALESSLLTKISATIQGR